MAILRSQYRDCWPSPGCSQPDPELSAQTIGQGLHFKVARGAEYEDIYSDYKDSLKTLQSPIDVERIAGYMWSACISLSEDSCFERCLRNHIDQIPNSMSVTEVSNSEIVIPDRTIPVYRLLGQTSYVHQESSLAITESDLMAREVLWPSILSSLPDFIKHGSILFFGTTGREYQVRRLLTVLMQMPKPRITELLFLADDKTRSDPSIQAILGNFRVKVIEGNIREVFTAIEDQLPSQSKRKRTKSASLDNLENLLGIAQK